MHSHGIQRNPEALNLYAAVAAEKAAATQTAAAVRKKLVRSASVIAGGFDKTIFAISQGQQASSDREQEEQAAPASKKTELRKDRKPDISISTWA
jgi:hypothetical protein